jgi:sensor c-di-GMP phosphodiesterase-like protein
MMQQAKDAILEYPNMKVSINMDANDLLDSKFLQTINNFFHNNPHLKKLV